MTGDDRKQHARNQMCNYQEVWSSGRWRKERLAVRKKMQQRITRT